MAHIQVRVADQSHLLHPLAPCSRATHNRIHAELVAFCTYLAPTPDERHTRALVIAQVTAVAHRRFPRANVDTFGSVAQDLYLPDACVRFLVSA